MKKRLISIILMFFFLNPLFSYGANNEELDIKGESALLMDANSGEIIYELNKDEGMPPASIAKIMTMLLGMEAVQSGRISLKDEVEISQHASSMGGTQVYLDAGEKQSVEDLFKAIAIRSANDASVALGEHIAGSEEAFVKMMNKRAKELGMNNSNFKNASGLPDDGHYVSAYDVALMSKELLKYDFAREWMTTYIYELKVGKKKNVNQLLVNTNKLIKEYKDITGVKTGSTNEAGYCLSASAKRDNLELIAVIMGAKTSNERFDQVKKMLDYGFDNYQSLLIGIKDEVIGNLQVNKGKISQLEAVLPKDTYFLLSKGQKDSIKRETILPEFIDAPVEKGEKVGELILSIEGREVHRVDLVAKDQVLKSGFLDNLKRSFTSFFL